MFQKAGEYAKAALYWHRAERGVREVWIPFMWGDLSNAPPRFEKQYRNILPEYQQRVSECLRQGNVNRAGLAYIESINEIWTNELVEQEEGGFRPACGRRAEEAEKHGDFLLAEVLRRGQARFFRTVAIPYHQRAAATCEKQGRRSEAQLYRQAAKAYKQRAAEADMLARGDRVLAGVAGLGGKDSRLGMGKLGHLTSVAIRDTFNRRVISYRGEPRTALTSQQVAAMLKRQGLTHAEGSARFAAVTVLANLGEKEAVLSALDDPSPLVRQAAGRALAGMRWADGWAACAQHRDAKVRQLVEPLLETVGEEVLARTYVITELIRGLDSSSPRARSFCQSALERITGRREEGSSSWSTWWKGLGDARSGLVRRGPGARPQVDEAIDFGAGWQSGLSSVRPLPNPVVKYRVPATIEWSGSLVVTEPGEYRFYVRNRGESMRSGRRVQTPGRWSFPAYFPAEAVTLAIDGKTLLPARGAHLVEDPSAWMRLDFTGPVRLGAGLHRIRLAFKVLSYDDYDSLSDTGVWGGHPCVRLYWSSEHFLRELVPAEHLVTID